jgi:hypothetical protein
MVDNRYQKPHRGDNHKRSHICVDLNKSLLISKESLTNRMFCFH